MIPCLLHIRKRKCLKTGKTIPTCHSCISKKTPFYRASSIIVKPALNSRGSMKGPLPLHQQSAAATCAARGADAIRFLYHFLAVCAAHKKMMFYPLHVCEADVQRQLTMPLSTKPASASTVITMPLLSMCTGRPVRSMNSGMPSAWQVTAAWLFSSVLSTITAAALRM